MDFVRQQWCQHDIPRLRWVTILECSLFTTISTLHFVYISSTSSFNACDMTSSTPTFAARTSKNIPWSKEIESAFPALLNHFSESIVNYPQQINTLFHLTNMFRPVSPDSIGATVLYVERSLGEWGPPPPDIIARMSSILRNYQELRQRMWSQYHP